MGQLIRDQNWALTPLGPTDQWSRALKTALRILLNSDTPTMLLWGPDSACFYNDALLAGFPQSTKPPYLPGKPGRELWAEGWPHIKPFIDHALAGHDIQGPNLLLPILQNGHHVLRQWPFRGYALLDDQDKPAGVFITCVEPAWQATQKAHQMLSDSERKFRDLVLEAPVGIAVFRGSHFIVEMANQAYLQIVDKSEKDFVGKPFFDSLPELRDSIESLIAGVLTSGRPVHGYEFPVPINRYSKTDIAYFNFVYQPVNENGTIDRIIVVANEVTESVKAKHLLAESEKQFRNLVMQSPIPMTIFRGPDYVIEMANPNMFDKIWKKKEHEVVGKKALELFPELKDQKFPQLLDTVFRTGKPHRELEAEAYVGGGHEKLKKFYLDFEYSPLFDPEGNVSGIMITVNDVTDRVEARQRIEERVRERTFALEESNQQLERSNEDLQQFAHVASHDLKEPVRKIKTYSHKLQDDFKNLLGDRGNQYLNKIISSTNRMYSMIDGVLNYASVTATEQPVMPVNLNAIIDNIANDLEVLIQEKKATLLYHDLPTIEGMPALLHQLFYNLINNSLKFSKTGIDTHISIESQLIIAENRQLASITLRDNGIGFDNQYAESIFTTFTRLNSKDHYEGTGLGLALCKKIVLRHHGFISARGQADKGAEFTILLPLIHNPH